jgi:hypothetical protein
VKFSSQWLAQTSAFLFPICGLAFAACGGSSDSPANTAGASGAPATPSAGSGGAPASGDPSKLVGSFQVKLNAADAALGTTATTSIVGKINDGPTPITTIWEAPQKDGDCTLTTPRVPFCTTPCGGSAACVEDDVCLAYPTVRSVGAVTMTGIKAIDGSTPLALLLVAGNYQAPPSVPLTYPAFAEGDAVTLAAAGEYYPAFSLSSKGIAPLALTSTGLALKSGQPLALTWTKGAESSAKIHVKLDISHHGGSKGQIECDTADSGALTVSAALISKLLKLGVAGYPTVIVTRHAIGSTAITPGRVELEISSTVEQTVTVDGLVSCSKNADCPDGQECQNDLSCK